MIRGYWVARELTEQTHFYKPFGRKAICKAPITGVAWHMEPGCIVTPRDVPDAPEFCASCRELSKRKPRKPHSDG